MILTRPKILIVDDQPSNLKAYSKLLADFDSNIITALSGNEALQLAIIHTFSLVLMDVQMPDMDGYETADLLLKIENNQQVPIIFITAAYKDSSHQIKGYRCGAVDYLEKPVDDMVLLSKVKVFLTLDNQKTALKVQSEHLKKEVTSRLVVSDSYKKLSDAVEQSPLSVMTTDITGTIEFVNQVFVSRTGYQKEDAIGRNPRFLQSGYTAAETYQELWAALTAGKTWRGEFHNKRKNGDLFWEHAVISPVYNKDSKISHYLAIKEDITKRKHYESILSKQQNFDDATDFPNRVLALDRMHQVTTLTQVKDQKTTILFIDVDNFKHINESFGQLKGNQVLAEVVARLTGCVRRDDTVARLGGDQFLILLLNMDEDKQIETFCQKILTSVSQAVSIEDQLIYISISIGITQSPTDGSDPHVLIQNAEAAMYQSKKEGGNAFHFFTTSMNTESSQRLTIENKLRQAIESEFLEVYYQPLIDIKSQSLIGAEALLRWTDDELGFISPETFIPIAEKMGMVDTVGEWVLSTATQQAQRWKQKFTVPFQIAVNFSAKQFLNKDITHTIKKILKSSKLAPDDLEVEITEQLLMLDKHDVKSRLVEIAELGASLSLDDFGTGYSSLSYLKKFPVKTVKIDRSFIYDVTTDPENAILTKTIITMAHSLKMKVIAEGVETKEQLDFLSRHGCNVAQGYYFSKPVPAEQFEVFFEQFSGNGKNDKFNND
jgi:diguanylate cyclase (GGDEF)-like protein/PAS domain S-box-containing protein